jgi:methylated-DNA-[protein]-cysteine S-methyltransferase
VNSPIGAVALGASASGLTELRFVAGTADGGAVLDDPPGIVDAGEATRAAAVLERVAAQLDEYFAGRRRAFSVPVAPRGTAFQHDVWHAVAAIPYGTTTSYGSLAAGMGRPRAARAVGHANGRTPVALVVPCHRVLGASGALTGYGGGLDAKRFLLRLEGAYV